MISTDQGVAPGEVIGGKYLVERVVGVGGVGVVLAARHVELEETVAIKLLHREMLERPDVVARFAAEAKAAVRIKSEYAARVYDVGVLPGRGPYFVMEYLEGRDLADALQEGGIPVKRAVELILEVCEALAVAHSNGIIHRDIKPENLFLSRRGDGTEVLKVLDFGISKASLTGSLADASAMVKTQELMGTPFYMSPEQIRATVPVDARTDIWSLGVVLYEMLTCQLPFPGETVPEICAKVIETQPAPLQVYLSVPDGLQSVLDRCLEKDRAKRFQNIAELAIALLPFGPSRARVRAERASTILGASGQSGVTFRFSSGPPPGSEPSSVSIPAAPPTPTFTGPPVPGGPTSVAPTLSSNPEALEALARENQTTRRMILASLAVVLGLLGLGATYFTRQVRSAAEAKPATAPSAVAAAPIASAPETAPARGDIAISLGARPAEARLFLDDVPLATNPFKKTVARDGQPHAVRAEAPGYATRSIAITYDSDKEIVLALDKASAAAAGAPGRWPPAPGKRPADAHAEATATPSTAAPSAPASTAARPAGIEEVDLAKTRKPARTIDTATPW